MNRRLSIMVPALLCMALSTRVNSQTLTQSLQRYCVPVGGYCASKAIYRNNQCECDSVNQYYELSSRSCRDCITGSFASNDYKRCEPIVCPAGYEAKLISNGACPSGYKLTQVTNGYCPSEHNLKEYVISSKIWR
ncbi:MAG: hypothetical protein ACI4N3_02490 [Alphaproteobacteria bacterium]